MAIVDDKYDAMSITEIIGNMGKAVSSGFKAAAQQMRFPGRGHWSEYIIQPKGRIDYSRTVGDGRGNSMLMASVLWAARNFPEAPLAMEQIKQGGKGNTPLPDHEMIKLVANPNPHYPGELLWNGTIVDWMFGNAYWRKIRGPYNKVVQLWWLPSQLVEPKWGSTKSFIDYYEYKYDAGEEPERIDPKDIVHFRNGIDPKNTRKGLSPLGALMREIFTDEEAAAYTATLLNNLGVPGMIISPGSDTGKIAPEDTEVIKAEAENRFTGNNRGRAMVLSGKALVQLLSFNPEQMQLRTVRTIPEERVTAIIGIPAIVVGLGAGLQRSTFSNFAEAREAAYESFMIPNQRMLSAQLRIQLLPDFVAVPDQYRVFFDLSQVRVLQTDENEIHNRAQNNLKSGLVMLDEARDAVGLSPLPNKQGQLFYVPASLTPTPPEELWTEPEPVPAALANANPPGLPQTGPDLPEKPPQTEEEPPDASQPQKGRILAFDVAYKANIPKRTSRQIERLRARIAGRTERSLISYFTKQRNRVIARLEENLKAVADAEVIVKENNLDLEKYRVSLKQLAGDDIFDVEEAARTLTELLNAQYLKALDGMQTMIEDALDISFELDDARSREFLKDAGKEIRGISEQTLGAVRAAVIEGQELGEGVDELAARIRNLPAFNSARAKTVARTELGHATNTAALYVYEGSSVVVGVQIFDGEEHAPCAEVNGKILLLQEAKIFPTLGHPNCVRAFGAVVDKAAIENAA